MSKVSKKEASVKSEPSESHKPCQIEAAAYLSLTNATLFLSFWFAMIQWTVDSFALIGVGLPVSTLHSCIMLQAFLCCLALSRYYLGDRQYFGTLSSMKAPLLRLYREKMDLRRFVLCCAVLGDLACRVGVYYTGRVESPPQVYISSLFTMCVVGLGAQIWYNDCDDVWKELQSY